MLKAILEENSYDNAEIVSYRIWQIIFLISSLFTL